MRQCQKLLTKSELLWLIIVFITTLIFIVVEANDHDTPPWWVARTFTQEQDFERMDTFEYAQLDKKVKEPQSTVGSAMKSSMYRPMPTAKINLYSKPALGEVEVELLYDNSSFPGGFTVSLMSLIDPNGTATDCFDPSFLSKRDSCTPTRSFKHHTFGYNCRNLEPGLYCARAHEIRTDGLEARLFYTKMEELEENVPTLTGTLLSSPRPSNSSKFLSIGLGIGCSIVALILLALLVKRCGKREIPSSPPRCEGKSELSDAIHKKPPVRVYLMYYPECCHHVEFIEFLAKFLSNNNFEVSYDLKELNSMAVNPVSWIQQKLSGRYKILLINSKSACEQQKLWLNNAGVIVNESAAGEADIFLSALAMITHNTKQAFDYSTVYMLRPSYVSKCHLLQNLCPGKYYEIPTELHHLVGHLHDLDPQRVHLEGWPSDIWKHCAPAYDDLLRQAHEVAGSDVPTESSRLAGICHACNMASADVIGNGISERLLLT